MKTAKQLQSKIKELEKQLAKYRELSIQDELTTLYNKRKFMEDVSKVCYNYNRYKTSFSVVLLDIDDFKKINDTKGHREGDIILYQVGITIKDSLRYGDRAYRLGGDEFALLLYNTANTTIKDRVVKRIKEKLTVNISCGVMSNQSNVNELIECVDKKMYEEKRKSEKS